MITLISTIVGFFSAGMPALLQFYQSKQDKAHELEIMKLQLEQAKLNLDIKHAEIIANYDVEQQKALYQTYNTGVHWVDALNGTVRPVIAYLLIFTYCWVEWTIFSNYDYATMPLSILVDNLWSDDDHALFCTVMAFYFGNRTFNNK